MRELKRRRRQILLFPLAAGAVLLLTGAGPSPRGAKEIFGSSLNRSGPFVNKRLTGETPPPEPPPRQPTSSSPAERPSPATFTPKPKPEPILDNVGLRCWIELVGAQQDRRGVTPDHTFRSGDRIRLHFHSNAKGHIALLQTGSDGRSSLLFPDPRAGVSDDQIAAGQQRVIPGETFWFRFDHHPGKERIVAIFDRKRQEVQTTTTLLAQATDLGKAIRELTEERMGSKNLLLETETLDASEIGVYAVSLDDRPVILELLLRHE